MGPRRFDMQLHRHTGEWFCLYRDLFLEEALEAIRAEAAAAGAFANIPPKQIRKGLRRAAFWLTPDGLHERS